jgi:hypothetical protein
MRSPILTATLAFALAAGPAAAGGFAPVVVAPEPVVVVEPPAPRSTFGVLLPLLLLGALIVIATQDDDEECDGDRVEVDGECVLPALSDSRLKTDILRTGTSPSGLPIYSYRYLGRPQLYQGVMAQDLVALRPEAVVEGPFGVLLVDYSRTDVEFRALD